MEKRIRTTSEPRRRLRFACISSCAASWGGSEELWSKAVSILAEEGHPVRVFKRGVDTKNPNIRRLKSLVRVKDLERGCILGLIKSLLPERNPKIPGVLQILRLGINLMTRRPTLIIISQGDHCEGLEFCLLCRRLRIPYVLICQKATDHLWPPDEHRKNLRDAFQSAIKCCFVSHHNRHMVEDQIGCDLANAAVVRNPFLVNSAAPLPWPATAQGFRLACVGRLDLFDKGQDLLIRVMALPKWKERNLHVSVIGQGINRDGLIELAQRFDVRNISFPGHTDDIEGIWHEHHALVLPSRREGLPLVLVEAMWAGRFAIVTNAGGNTEVIADQITGFVAATASEFDLDRAMENAWQRRHEWRDIGLLAANRIRALVPSDPARVFADDLVQIGLQIAKARG